VGRELVLAAVAREEGDLPLAHRAHHQRRRRRAERRVDLDLADVVQERVEARSSEDPDPDRAGSVRAAQADRSLLDELEELPPSELDGFDGDVSSFEPPSDAEDDEALLSLRSDDDEADRRWSVA
jgi:hypothetical protein